MYDPQMVDRPQLIWIAFENLAYALQCQALFNSFTANVADRRLGPSLLTLFKSLFSAPEPKAQVHYCDHALSVVRLSSVVRRR